MYDLSWSDLFSLATVAGLSSTWLWVGSLHRRLKLGEQELDRLRATSRTDSLTGLGSQRYFDSERWPAAVRASSTALTVAYIDLDGLRSLNNTLGHEAGDRLLVRAADALMSVARGGSDEAFRRYNAGDEFVILFRGTADAAALGARLLSALSGSGVRASIGLDCCGTSATLERRRALLARAEESCRAAKVGGVNRVVVARPESQRTEAHLDAVPSPIEGDSLTVPYSQVSERGLSREREMGRSGGSRSFSQPAVGVAI